MGDKVKSIFRRREVEKLYEIGVNYDGNWFSGERLYTLLPKTNSKRVFEEKTIGEYDIDIPLLEPKEHFYLENINEEVIVKNRMRSSDGSIVYYVEDKVVETKNTKESYDKCVKSIEEWDHDDEKFKKMQKRIKELISKTGELEAELLVAKDTYKYKHKFFNFRTE